MSNRRTLTSSLSARVITYLCERGHSQAEIARMLHVSEGFVSLVKSRERSLTIEHLELLASALGVPLGAMLLAMTPLSPKASGETKRFFEVSERVIRMVDKAREAILRSAPVAPR